MELGNKAEIVSKLHICIYIYICIKIHADIQDLFYQLTKRDNFRARSAYKQQHLIEQLPDISCKRRYLDLCAAPGSWSQLICRLREENKDEPFTIVSVDMQEIQPIDGCIIVNGDIMTDICKDIQIETFKTSSPNGRAQIILYDGAPDVTGFTTIDEYLQFQLFTQIFDCILPTLLEKDGIFIAKFFYGTFIDILIAKMYNYFSNVHIVKPSSSRIRSTEHFIIAHGYQ